MLARRIYALFLAGATMLLAACGGGGGGGGSSSSATPSLQISGTAATGAAIISGTVEAKCKVGTGTATTNASGNYTLEVASGEQPCILRVTDPITLMRLHSVVEAGANNANITPVTDLVVANTLVESPTTAFTNYSAVHQQKITAGNISTAVTRVQTATAALGSDADMTGIDIMKGTLQAATADTLGNAADAKIDALMAALAAADKKISELSALLATTNSGAAAATQLTTLVGNAQYALASCPAARSGDIWVLDFLGTAPMGFNANFSTMVLKNLADNSTSAINFKRDAQNTVIPCAFTANVNASSVEFRVTDGGIGVWKNANDFGITVPAQRTKALTDIAFAGTYPTAGFLRERSQGTRAAVPFKFKINADGSLQGYSCDLTKAIPDCNLAMDTSNSGDTTCTSLSNGTLSCSAANGLRATAVLYATGGQASMFMAVTQMPYNGYSFGGLIVMTKASPMKLPTVGQTTAAGSSWYAGVGPGSNTVVSGDTSAGRVESISTSANAYVTSSVGSSITYTRYLNTPTDGFQLSNASNGLAGITVGSSTGWSMTMAKNSGSTAYDGWAVYARAKR
jgi:hypothetical protein